MILDSILLITLKCINTNGKIPQQVNIRRKGVKRVYHITTVVDLACKIAGTRAPNVHDLKAVRGVVYKAVCDLHRNRTRTPYKFVLKKMAALPETRVGVVDLRPGMCNVAGLALDRLLGVMNNTKVPPSPWQSQAAIELMKITQLVIVETREQANRIEDYLASRALLPLVATSEQVKDFPMPNTEGEWSAPTVDHQ